MRQILLNGGFWHRRYCFRVCIGQRMQRGEIENTTLSANESDTTNLIYFRVVIRNSLYCIQYDLLECRATAYDLHCAAVEIHRIHGIIM